MKLENEKNVKLILAIWIILSHLPGMRVLGAYNYLPVAGFFFLSGYGLMMKSKSNSKNKNWKIFISFILVLIYSILFRYMGQILTSYKTVFAFVVGLWYATHENKVFKYINLYSCVFCGVVSLAIRFIVTDNETIFDSVLYNLSGIFFCFSLVYSIYKINIKNKKIDFFYFISLE